MMNSPKNIKTIIIVICIVVFPVWVLLYVGSYFFFTSQWCSKTYPHDYNKNHCLHYGNKIFQLLELNPIIRLYTNSRLLKNDLMPQKYVNQAYELLAFVDYVFTKHDVKYALDGGSEIGAIRHGGFIPWDDDLDIIVFDELEKIHNILLEEIKNQPRRFEYVINNMHKDFSIHALRIKDGIIMDLFFLDKCKNQYYDNMKKYSYTFEDGCPNKYFIKLAYDYDEIFPLKKCNFGPLKVSCKNNVFKPYSKYYGDDWMQVAYTGNHVFNKHRIKKITLTPELLKPALPDNDAYKVWVNKKQALLQTKKK